jgi:hypothetical protein
MSIWKRLFRRELKRLLTDRRIVVIMLAGPFFYAFLFGGVYWQGRVREIPIVIVDQDHSEMSRDLSRALLASENLSLAFSELPPLTSSRPQNGAVHTLVSSFQKTSNVTYCAAGKAEWRCFSTAATS